MQCVECQRDLGPTKTTGRPRRYCSRSCQSKAYRRRQDAGRLAVRKSSLSRTTTDAPLLKAAVDLADEAGTAAVTLRKLADLTGTQLKVVQRRFGSRDRLVVAMVDNVYARAPERASPAEPPQTTLLRLAQQEWADYRAHPWLVTVLASTRPALAPAVMAAAQQYIAAFVALGLNSDVALGRYLALSAYIQGMALLLISEQEETRYGQQSLEAWWVEEVDRLNRTGARRDAQWIRGQSPGQVADATDIDQWFQDGLQHVIAGLLSNR